MGFYALIVRSLCAPTSTTETESGLLLGVGESDPFGQLLVSSQPNRTMTKGFDPGEPEHRPLHVKTKRAKSTLIGENYSAAHAFRADELRVAPAARSNIINVNSAISWTGSRRVSKSSFPPYC
jgi:hypothetical protein